MLGSENICCDETTEQAPNYFLILTTNEDTSNGATRVFE